MHTALALLCFVVVMYWLIYPYPSGLLHWHCGNLTIAPVPAKQPWWIWVNASCEFIMNDYITTTKQSTTKPCANFLGYTVHRYKHSHGWLFWWFVDVRHLSMLQCHSGDATATGQIAPKQPWRCGSGHEGGPVLLPGFAIKWYQNQVTRQTHLQDRTNIATNQMAQNAQNDIVTTMIKNSRTMCNFNETRCTIPTVTHLTYLVWVGLGQVSTYVVF